jgi:hypothetical protein
MKMPNVELFKRNRKIWGRLLEMYSFETPIDGFSVDFDNGHFRCSLRDDGFLVIHAMSEYDFGSGGITVQDLGMVRASLAHDAFCFMTDAGVLPWSVRRKADNYFASLLWETGRKGPIAVVSTGWRWTGVTLYSQCIARWGRVK